MNVGGMLPFENMVKDYVRSTGNHVLYRVTPVFEGDNLVASGAMTAPIYFDTYGEAESYSIQIAPSQDKRKCGNCW